MCLNKNFMLILILKIELNFNALTNFKPFYINFETFISIDLINLMKGSYIKSNKIFGISDHVAIIMNMNNIFELGQFFRISPNRISRIKQGHLDQA